jgi:glycopeptide antibiotics resistance protein
VDDPGAPVTPARRWTDAGLAAAVALVALLTLVPQGGGWAWGAPLAELRWYATGLGSEATLLQLLGNLALLGPLAVLAVLRWPALAAPRRLAWAALAVAVGIEALQWALPLGRVVSPVDAALNVAGALLAGGTAALLTAPKASAASWDRRSGACRTAL